MKKSKLLFLWVLVAVVLFGGIYVLYNKLSAGYSPDSFYQTVTVTDEEGEVENSQTEPKKYPAPDFVMQTPDGSEVRLSDYFGKPIVLNFWASWCPPCKGEMPHFEEAFKNNSDINFIMLNVTASDSMTDAKAFVEENGYTFPVFYDTDGMASYIYGAASLPTTFFIDAEGNLVTYAVGALSAEKLDIGLGFIKE